MKDGQRAAVQSADEVDDFGSDFVGSEPRVPPPSNFDRVSHRALQVENRTTPITPPMRGARQPAPRGQRGSRYINNRHGKCLLLTAVSRSGSLVKRTAAGWLKPGGRFCYAASPVKARRIRRRVLIH